MGILPERSRATAAPPSAESKSSQARDPSDVILPTQIAHILDGLSRRHALITVRLPESAEAFTSAILKLDRNAGVLLMDELNPAEGHHLLLAQKRLHVSGRLKGIAVAFETSLLQTTEEDGIAIYTVAIPPLLHYHQRRAYFRAVVGVANPVTTFLETRDGRLIEGQVHDISPGGIGARFMEVEADELQRGQRLETCMLNLPDGHTLQTALEICFVDTSGAPDQVKVGGRFINLSRGHEHAIARFIASLERQRLKTRPKD